VYSNASIDATLPSLRESLDREHIPSLDGIRAAAFALVFLAHANLTHLIPGGFGVTVFFFLSGYLISSLMRREFQQNQRIDIGRFYLRRCLRILPSFYMAMLVAYVLYLTNWLPLGVPGAASADMLTTQAAFLANYIPMVLGPERSPLPGTEVYWSLAVVEHFYLLFPFLAAGLLNRRSRRTAVMVLAGCCLAFLVWRCLLVYGCGYGALRVRLCSDTRGDSILFGCLLAFALDPFRDRRPKFSQSAKVVTAVGALALILLSIAIRDPSFRFTFRYTLQGIALLPLFYLAVAEHRTLLLRPLNHPVVAYLGQLTYSLYLIHFVMITVVFEYLGQEVSMPTRLAGLLVSLALSVAYAIAMRHFVEAPLAKLRKKYRADRSPTAFVSREGEMGHPPSASTKFANLDANTLAPDSAVSDR